MIKNSLPNKYIEGRAPLRRVISCQKSQQTEEMPDEYKYGFWF